MPVRMVVVPLVPRSLVVDVTKFVNDLDRELAVNFSGAVIRDMTVYPAVRPWARGFPRSGPRRGGRRTGRYGQGWQLRVHRRGTFVEVSNPVFYSVFVGGPKTGTKGRRQAAFMARRGWPSIDDSVNKRWPPTRRAIVRIVAGTGNSRRRSPNR